LYDKKLIDNITVQSHTYQQKMFENVKEYINYLDETIFIKDNIILQQTKKINELLMTNENLKNEIDIQSEEIKKILGYVPKARKDKKEIYWKK